MRNVADAVSCIYQTGCPWRRSQRGSRRAVFLCLADGGVWKAINHLLLMGCARRAGREAGPSALEAGGLHCYAAEKIIKGRKHQRPFLTDDRPAGRDDRASPTSKIGTTRLPFWPARDVFPWLHHVSADGGYVGES